MKILKQFLGFYVIGTFFALQGQLSDSRMTREIVIDIDNSVTACCADLNATITECCSDVLDALSSLSINIAASALCNAQAITEATTIMDAGVYCLANDINGQITINADNVVLDLNGHQIFGGTNGVAVSMNLDSIVIKNGFIKSTIEQGILIDSGCSNVIVQDLVVVDCGSQTLPFGIDVVGDLSGSPLNSNCIVERCIVSDGSSGIRLFNTINSAVRHCDVFNLTTTVIEAIGVSIEALGGASPLEANCEIVSCKASQVVGVGFSIRGDASVSVSNVSIKDSTAQECSGGMVINQFTTNIYVKNCLSTRVSEDGISVNGDNSIIENCIALGGDKGFVSVGSNNLFDHCKAIGNTGGDGFGFEVTGSLLRFCISESNLVGFELGDSASICNSKAFNNTNTGFNGGIAVDNVSVSNGTNYNNLSVGSGDTLTEGEATTAGYNFNHTIV